MMGAATVGLCCLDTNLCYTYINDWLAEINGMSAKEHLGRSVRELFPELADHVEPQFQQVIDTGVPILKGRAYAETPARPGEKRLFEHNYFQEKKPDGTVSGICCFVEDITEREQAWENLKESEKKFRTLVNSVNAVPWRFDLKKNRFTLIGEHVEKLLGYPVSYWKDFNSWSSCIHNDDRDEAVKFCTDSTAKGIDHDFEYRCVTADHNIVWIRDIVTLRKNDEGTATELYGYMIEITERKKTEEALREGEEKYRTLTESNPYGFQVIDTGGIIKYTNPAYQRMLGYTEEELLGKSIFDLLNSDEARVKLRAYLPILVKDKPDPTTYEQKNRAKDGKIIDQNVDWDYRLDDEGRVVGFASVITDITEQKQLEHQVSQYQDHLETLVAKRTSEILTRELSSQVEHQVLQHIVAAEDIDQALRTCLIELSEFLEYEYAEIWILREDTNFLKAHYQWSSVPEDSKQFAECSADLTLEKGQDVAGCVWSTGEPEWRSNDGRQSDLDNFRDKTFRQLGIKSLLGVPVKTNGALLAVFCFYSPYTKVTSKETIELISAITLQAALAIDRLHVTSSIEHLIESAPGAMLVTSENGTIKMQNNVCSKLFGYTDSELLGSSIEVLIPESFHKKHRRLREDVERHTLPRPMGSGLKIRGRKKDGTEIPVDVSLNLQKTVYGNRFIVGIVDLREHQKNLDELSASRERLRDLTNHMTSLTERERKSIARDLHDDLGQVLTSLKIDVAILGRQVQSLENTDISESMTEDLTAMSETLGKAGDRLHAFVNKLRPEVLDNLGLITTLEWQTEEFFKTHEIKCEFICSVDHMTVNDEIAIAIYRIVQECLTNISRHSKARNSKVKVDRIDDTLTVEVSDDGMGISNEILTSTTRFGILGIKERASALGGNVQIESTSGEGTTIRIIIPIKP